MKKLFSLLSILLCATMLSTVSFAATTPDVYSIYKKASDSLNTATSLEMSGVSKTTLEAEGVELGASTQNTTIKMMNLTGKKLQMEMHSKESDTNEAVDIYYKDGYMYTKDGNKKTKYKLSIESALSTAGAFDTTMTKDFFKDATVEKTGDDTRIKFKINFNDLKSDDGKSLMEEIAASMPDAKVKVSSISYSMLIGSDNKLKSYAMAFSMTIESEGVTIKAKNNTNYKIVSVDKISKINFPADLSSYKLA